MPAPTRAVAYYRMSTGQQEASIPRQRESVHAYAKANGYEIVREYEDTGISGDATERRTGFLGVRDDAGKGEFDVIPCWDKDRFGRFDSIEQGYRAKPLRDAGHFADPAHIEQMEEDSDLTPLQRREDYKRLLRTLAKP
jgi:site-specific DNA recombinase